MSFAITHSANTIIPCSWLFQTDTNLKLASDTAQHLHRRVYFILNIVYKFSANCQVVNNFNKCNTK